MENLQEKIAELRKKVDSEKALRDEETKKVTEFKKLRNDLLDNVTALRIEVAKIEASLEKVSDTIDESLGKLKKRYKDLDWDYQTRVTSHAKEKDIVKTLQHLEVKIDLAEGVLEERRKLKNLYREIKQLRSESDFNHELVMKHAAESENHHQNMLKTHDQLNKLESKLKAQSRVHQAMKPIRQIVKKFTHKKDPMRAKAEQILEDFKQGKKVSLQDLSLLEKYDLY
jgi:phosphoserine phosphatase